MSRDIKQEILDAMQIPLLSGRGNPEILVLGINKYMDLKDLSKGLASIGKHSTELIHFIFGCEILQSFKCPDILFACTRREEVALVHPDNVKLLQLSRPGGKDIRSKQ